MFASRSKKLLTQEISLWNYQRKVCKHWSIVYNLATPATQVILFVLYQLKEKFFYVFLSLEGVQLNLNFMYIWLGLLWENRAIIKLKRVMENLLHDLLHVQGFHGQISMPIRRHISGVS